MYSFFYGTFTYASTNNLDSAMNSTFHEGGSSPDTHTVEEKEKIKEKAGTGERSQTE